MKNPIVVVGSLNMDLVVRAARHPKIGETIIGSAFQTFPGGKGANQAVAAARLGGQVRMIGRVGSDDFGQALLNGVLRDGVDATHIQRDPAEATGVALITVDDLGRNTIVVASGANGRLLPGDILAAESAFDGAAALVMQLESPLPALEQAVEIAHRRGLKIILNPAPAQPLPAALLTGCDILVPNESELALLSGVQGVEDGVRCLQAQGVRCLVVTLGEQGVLVADGAQRTSIAAHSVAAVDTVAAGDAFVGALAVALTEGLELAKAAEWGNAAAAISVTRRGAQPSLPTRDEVEQFLRGKS